MLVQWLQSNKIALNVNKTDIIIFWSGLGTNNSDIPVMVQRAQNKVLRIINFNQERHQVHFYTQRQRYLIL